MSHFFHVRLCLVCMYSGQCGELLAQLRPCMLHSPAHTMYIHTCKACMLSFSSCHHMPGEPGTEEGYDSPYFFIRIAPKQLHDEIGMEFIEWTLDQLLERVGIRLLHFTHLLQRQLGIKRLACQLAWRTTLMKPATHLRTSTPSENL